VRYGTLVDNLLTAGFQVLGNPCERIFSPWQSQNRQFESVALENDCLS
ncbi:hypothetical protein LEMLEM_LOCUS24795, partial [Lemmus lemmus]